MATAPSTPSLPLTGWRYALRTFRSRNFRLFFTGQSISLIGTWAQSVAISWLVWRLTHSSVWLGIITFSSQIPILFLGLVGGALADRYDRLRLLTAAQVLCMANAVILVVLVYLNLIALWHLVALSLMLGFIYAFEFPLRQSFVMDMVGRADLLNAVSLNSAMFHLTRIAGPVAAGVIIEGWGEQGCFLFNVLTFIPLIIALLLIRRGDLIATRREDLPFKRAIVEGICFAWRDLPTRLALLVLGAIAGAGFAYVSLMPIFADRILGGGAVELGALMAASGAGALFGALFQARRPHTEALLPLCTKTTLIASVTIIAFARTTTFWIALLLLMIIGFFLNVAFTSIVALLQGRSPDHLRGRMMSIYTTIFMGCLPVASIIAGLLAEEIGAPWTVAAGGALCFALTMAVHLKGLALEENGGTRLS